MARGAIRYQGSVREVLTPEHLKQIFNMDFSVRPLSGGKVEVLPIIHEETSNET
jgi:ABC-type enterochelin transport system ATPase subunit